MSELVFAVNGSVVRLAAASVNPNTKLVTFLRDDQQLRGTKVGCGEGGCGACSVLLSRWDATMGKVVTISANSCLRPLTTLHGWMVTTVEGVGGARNANGLHPIQKRFHQLNASQCGFCTPGFVVSVYSQLAKKKDSTMIDIEESLDGNLCRCTGYRPILDAAKSFACDSDIVDHIGKSELGKNEGMDVQNEIDAAFPAALKNMTQEEPAHFKSADIEYIRVATSTQALQAAMKYGAHGASVALVVSQTSAGVYKEDVPTKSVLIDVGSIPELRQVVVKDSSITVGSATPISTFIGLLLQEGSKRGGAANQACTALHDIIKKIANVHVRDVGSIGGNLMMAKNLGFASDLATPLCGVGANVTYLAINGRFTKDLYTFLQAPEDNIILESVQVPFTEKGTFTYSYRQAIRVINAHAILNASFRVTIDDSGIMRNVEAVYGGAGEFDVRGKNAPRRNTEIVSLLQGKQLSKAFIRDIANNFHSGAFLSGEYKLAHRQKLVKAFLMKFLEDVRMTLVGDEVVRPATFAHSGAPRFTATTASTAPVGEAIVRPDGVEHASGNAIYISDIKEPRDAFYLAWVQSTIAKGKVKNIPVEILKDMEGSPVFFGPKDFEGTGAKNEILNIVAAFMPLPFLTNYPIMCEEVGHQGQFIGMVYASSGPAAQRAAKALAKAVTYDVADDAVITTAQAIKAGAPNMFFANNTDHGDVKVTSADKELQHVEHHVSLNSQKHFYMETHAAFAVPQDSGLVIYVGQQSSQLMSLIIRHALGKQQNEIQVKQYRVGGSFGAKLMGEHAIMAAIIALKTNRAAKFHLDRNTDMRSQGGRQETKVDLQIDFAADGRIQGVSADCFKNCGLRFDWSSFTVMMLLPKHIGSVYNITNIHIASAGLKTNTAPRTAVRAPGEIEAAFVTEEIIDRVAFAVGVHSQVIRERNFFKEIEGEVYTFPEMYETLMTSGGWRERLDNSIEFNKIHHAKKRGVAITPFKYHVASRAANAQINIFQDGSVIVHHCGVEMGQGLIVKVLQAACYELSKVAGPIPLSLFRSAGNDTFVVPVGGMTGGSVGSETNVFAVLQAAAVLVERLKPIAESLPAEKRSWHAVVGLAGQRGIPFTAVGQFQGTGKTSEYNIYCAGAAEIELDVYTGQVTTLRVDVKYDAARSLNPAVDIGQAEGAFMMGLGFFLLEDAKLCEKTGAQPHDGTWEYKIPSVQDTPREFNVELIHNEKFEGGIMSSKASGEPPLCVATCLTSAIRQAVTSARKDAELGGFPELTAPWTCDKLAVACGNRIDED